MNTGSDIIALALAEDIGDGDVTVRAFTDPASQSSAKIVAKEKCCLAGSAVATEVFRRVDPSLHVSLRNSDGDSLRPGDCVLEVTGPTGSILTAERTALNFIQRLSGVATMTRRFVEAVSGTKAVILDTRKTTPGLRKLEKAAVAAGGGKNHRMGLFDMVLVKDNHLAAGGEIADLQSLISRSIEINPGLRIEVEADTLDQVRAFFGMTGIDVILLDNMTLEQMREAVRLRPSGVQLEASGGVNLETIRGIAETGVDFISVGALTHSAPSVDFSLEIA